MRLACFDEVDDAPICIVLEGHLVCFGYRFAAQGSSKAFGILRFELWRCFSAVCYHLVDRLCHERGAI